METKIKIRKFRWSKWKFFLEGLKFKVHILIGTENIFNPYFYISCYIMLIFYPLLEVKVWFFNFMSSTRALAGQR